MKNKVVLCCFAALLCLSVSAGAENFLFFDNFEDGQVSWRVKRGTWQEQSSTLIGGADGRAAILLPETWELSGFGSCSVCSADVDFTTTGGNRNRVAFVGWWADKQNRIEVIMKEELDTFVLKHFANGVLVGRQKGTHPIEPGTKYKIIMDFDGTNLTVRIDSQLVLSHTVNAPVNGTFGFKVNNTIASFNLMRVYNP